MLTAPPAVAAAACISGACSLTIEECDNEPARIRSIGAGGGERLRLVSPVPVKGALEAWLASASLEATVMASTVAQRKALI